jgi:hypothetical protein
MLITNLWHCSLATPACVLCSCSAGWPPVTDEEKSSQPALSLLQCLEQSEGGRLCLEWGCRVVVQCWKVLPSVIVYTVRSSLDPSVPPWTQATEWTADWAASAETAVWCGLVCSTLILKVWDSSAVWVFESGHELFPSVKLKIATTNSAIGG